MTAVVIALPFLAVDFPPITDLPQQTAQIKLAFEVLDGSDEYRFNLLAPGTLSYGLFTVGWRLAGAKSAGRIAYFLLACLWLAIASLRADMPRQRQVSRIASMLPALALTAM